MSDYWIISDSYTKGRATLTEAINYQLAGRILRDCEGQLYTAAFIWWGHVMPWARARGVSELRLLDDLAPGWVTLPPDAPWSAKALIVLRGAANDTGSPYQKAAAAMLEAGLSDVVTDEVRLDITEEVRL